MSGRREELGTVTRRPAANLKPVTPEPQRNIAIMPQLEGRGQPVLACLHPEQLEAVDEICDYTGLTRSEAVRMLVALGLEALELGAVAEQDGDNR